MPRLEGPRVTQRQATSTPKAKRAYAKRKRNLKAAAPPKPKVVRVPHRGPLTPRQRVEKRRTRPVAVNLGRTNPNLPSSAPTKRAQNAAIRNFLATVGVQPANEPRVQRLQVQDIIRAQNEGLRELQRQVAQLPKRSAFGRATHDLGGTLGHAATAPIVQIPIRHWGTWGPKRVGVSPLDIALALPAARVGSIGARGALRLAARRAAARGGLKKAVTSAPEIRALRGLTMAAKRGRYRDLKLPKVSPKGLKPQRPYIKRGARGLGRVTRYGTSRATAVGTPLAATGNEQALPAPVRLTTAPYQLGRTVVEHPGTVTKNFRETLAGIPVGLAYAVAHPAHAVAWMKADIVHRYGPLWRGDPETFRKVAAETGLTPYALDAMGVAGGGSQVIGRIGGAGAFGRAFQRWMTTARPDIRLAEDIANPQKVAHGALARSGQHFNDWYRNWRYAHTGRRGTAIPREGEVVPLTLRGQKRALRHHQTATGGRLRITGSHIKADFSARLARIHHALRDLKTREAETALKLQVQLPSGDAAHMAMTAERLGAMSKVERRRTGFEPNPRYDEGPALLALAGRLDERPELYDAIRDSAEEAKAMGAEAAAIDPDLTAEGAELRQWAPLAQFLGPELRGEHPLRFTGRSTGRGGEPGPEAPGAREPTPGPEPDTGGFAPDLEAAAAEFDRQGARPVTPEEAFPGLRKPDEAPLSDIRARGPGGAQTGGRGGEYVMGGRATAEEAFGGVGREGPIEPRFQDITDLPPEQMGQLGGAGFTLNDLGLGPGGEITPGHHAFDFYGELRATLREGGAPEDEIERHIDELKREVNAQYQRTRTERQIQRLEAQFEGIDVPDLAAAERESIQGMNEDQLFEAHRRAEDDLAHIDNLDGDELDAAGYTPEIIDDIERQYDALDAEIARREGVAERAQAPDVNAAADAQRRGQAEMLFGIDTAHEGMPDWYDDEGYVTRSGLDEAAFRGVDVPPGLVNWERTLREVTDKPPARYITDLMDRPVNSLSREEEALVGAIRQRSHAAMPANHKTIRAWRAGEVDPDRPQFFAAKEAHARDLAHEGEPVVEYRIPKERVAFYSKAFPEFWNKKSQLDSPEYVAITKGEHEAIGGDTAPEGGGAEPPVKEPPTGGGGGGEVPPLKPTGPEGSPFGDVPREPGDLARVKEIAAEQGRPEPGYFPSQLAESLRHPTGRDAALRTISATRQYTGALFQRGIEDPSLWQLASGLSRSVDRATSWAHASQMLTTTALRAPGNYTAIMNYLAENRIDPADVAIVSRGELRKLARDNSVNFGDAIAHAGASQYLQNADLVVVPQAAVDAFGHAPGNYEGWKGLNGFLKVKASRAILGSLNLPWLQFQVLSNVAMTGLARTGPMDIIKAQIWWRSLDDATRREVEPLLGQGHFSWEADAQPRLFPNSSNAWLKAWHAWRDAHPGLAKWNLLSRMFQADRFQNAFFRKGVLYSQVKRDAYRRLGKSAGHMERLQEQLNNTFKLGPQEQLAAVLKDRTAMLQHAKHVDTFLGDYLSFTPKERSYLASNVMFYAFLRYSLRMVFYTMPVQHPIMTSILGKLGFMGASENRQILGPGTLPYQLGAFYYHHSGLQKIDFSRANPALSALTQNTSVPATVGSLLPPHIQIGLTQVYAATPFSGAVRLGTSTAEVNPLDWGLKGSRLRVATRDALSLFYPYRTAEKIIAGGRRTARDSLIFPTSLQAYTAYKRGDRVTEQQQQEALVQRAPFWQQLAREILIGFPKPSTERQSNRRRALGGQSAPAPYGPRPSDSSYGTSPGGSAGSYGVNP